MEGEKWKSTEMESRASTLVVYPMFLIHAKDAGASSASAAFEMVPKNGQCAIAACRWCLGLGVAFVDMSVCRQTNTHTAGYTATILLIGDNMMYGHGGQIESAKECRRDWEADAKRMKKRIDVFVKLREAIEEFIKEQHLHWFDEREHRTAMLVALGGMSLEIPALEKEYDRILAEIEKER